MQPTDIVIVFAILTVVVVTITAVFWFVGGVPYVPTPKFVARAMVDLARLKGSESIVDMGAGNGLILIEAKRKHPGVAATGVEIAPTVWCLGRVNILLSGQKVRLLCGSALNYDASGADAIFLYLSPALMASLEEKFDRELKTGTVVISHAFKFPRRQPVETVVLPHWSGKKTVRRYEW